MKSGGRSMTTDGIVSDLNCSYHDVKAHAKMWLSDRPSICRTRDDGQIGDCVREVAGDIVMYRPKRATIRFNLSF
jgi:hypothetical protein